MEFSYLEHVSESSNCCQITRTIFFKLFQVPLLVRLLQMHVNLCRVQFIIHSSMLYKSWYLRSRGEYRLPVSLLYQKSELEIWHNHASYRQFFFVVSLNGTKYFKNMVFTKSATACAFPVSPNKRV